MYQAEIEKNDYETIFDNMVSFISNLGISVHTNTKARGHQGFFLKGRIDISSKLTPRRKIEVLIHEFTHMIHHKIDPTISKKHGNLESLFPNSDLNKIEQELLFVTRFVDNNKSLATLYLHKGKVLKEIKELSEKIKIVYPDFKRSYSHKALEKRINNCDAKYLLKYDRVKVKTLLSFTTKIYTIESMEIDFPELNEYELYYIKLKSKQRALKRISSRINRLEKYYKRPSELFARFVEALFIDTQKVSELAPHAYLVFCKELAQNRYYELADLINNFF